ncbi:TonB-dependent receptor plug domain-containing protein [Macellibacteroides fermentans]|uniref:Outer membrane receptor proteins, mostly Fe transport n=1 Tax=Parabacteroides chartae TaxID=1037355 RepID=A0A1T5A655_9BACT|nr:TonB-dependent receptor plug domain-containing protein [Parabacteroides chartae]SKB30418.1 Outer membrane receptor proteins, mostly Fe transport [Parabacteroides chartae]
MIKRLGIIILFCFFEILAFSQELKIEAYRQSLDKVLKSLPYQLSYNNRALSRYNVTVNQTFSSPLEAIQYLLKDKPFTCEQIGGVYVITPMSLNLTPLIVSPVTYPLVISITDAETGEPLPYAHIVTASGLGSTGPSGIFQSREKSLLPRRYQVHYIGYESKDTLLVPGRHTLILRPCSIALNEIIITTASDAMMMQMGKTSGEMRLNQQMAGSLPGGSDNSVFSLLRLMPGVRVSGEPSDDLIVWDSGISESGIVYDGFTIFGLKNFNDNISSVNPFMVKDIRLMKGGYDVSWGNHSGAVAEITGVSGQTKSPVFKVAVSNLTANIFGSVPITRRSEITVALRQTYYNLYDPEEIAFSSQTQGLQVGTKAEGSGGPGSGGSNGGGSGLGNGGSGQRLTDLYIMPVYKFGDVNMKLTGRLSENDSYYLSLYAAEDRFKFDVMREDSFAINAEENSRQYAGAASYNRVWSDGSSSRFLFTYSRLNSESDQVTKVNGRPFTPLELSHTGNHIQESGLTLSHHFAIYRQQIRIGAEWMYYQAGLGQSNNGLHKPALFVTDNIRFDKLDLTAGIRVDYPDVANLYIQPRLSARYVLSPSFAATASWGLYNQFYGRGVYQNEAGNYQYVWKVLPAELALLSMHSVAGVSYSNNGLLISLEGYSKHSDVLSITQADPLLLTERTTYGADLFLKKEFGRHKVFGSYSLVSSNYPESVLAHEIKSGVIFAFGLFRLSGSYVYGTGYNLLISGGQGRVQGKGKGLVSSSTSTLVDTPYSRLDLAVNYRFNIKKTQLQTGLSFLNLFNTRNIKYSYQVEEDTDITNIYTKATPFTPVLFVEIRF